MKTQWENTENLIVTSDAMFERVTNNEKMEEEERVGSLRQNTAWLVDEIPNISFLDIWDTFLETKKTLANKAWYILVVWQNGKSIEAVPYSEINFNL